MFIHEPSRSVVLKVRDPFALRELIPQSKTLVHPAGNFAAKHTLQTVKLLRNLGIHVPSPIRYQYDWPGKFTPFDHQYDMSEFWTLHRRGFNLSEQGCVSADTEYLSPEGWKRIDQYVGGDVAQYLPDTGEIEFVDPVEYVKLPCAAMVRFQTKYGVDQLLSPEHRVLLADGKVVSAAHVLATYGSQSVEARGYRFRTTFKVKNAKGLPLSDALIRVQVAANADGWFPENGRRCYIRLKRQRKIERLRALLAAAGLDHWERPCSPDGFVKFSFTPPMRKGFGPAWWAASQAQLEVVADEITHWDGSARKAGASAFTGTHQDADFAQYAYSASGRRATLKSDPRRVDMANVHASTETLVGLSRPTANTKAPNVRTEPSPDGFKYCFMVPSTFLLLRRNGCIVATGNTAKTNAALWAADYLMRLGDVHKVLVLAPLSTLTTVWLQDIFDTLMHRQAVVVHGDRAKRKKALAANADFYILNHDGVRIKEIMRLIRQRTDIDLVILDEGDEFRNASTDKYKSLAAMLRPDVRLWWQTGTPTPNDPTDAWAQARLVNPTCVPPYYGQFKRETMVQVTPFKWVPRKGAHERAFEALQPAIRFKKADCLDLPPVITLERQAALTPEQIKAFEAMKEEMYLDDAKHVLLGAPITAVNAADKIGKLRQILCGCIKQPDSNLYVPLPHGPRVHTLMECIKGASAKVIVIVPFKGIINDLAVELRKHYTVGLLNGDVSATQRTRTIQEFKHSVDPHILLCHPKVMSHGLNLTEADTTIFYAPIYSNSQYQQVIERFNRSGQTRKMTLIRIGAHPMEWEIYNNTDTATASQASMLALYQRVLAS